MFLFSFFLKIITIARVKLCVLLRKADKSLMCFYSHGKCPGNTSEKTLYIIKRAKAASIFNSTIFKINFNLFLYKPQAICYFNIVVVAFTYSWSEKKGCIHSTNG